MGASDYELALAFVHGVVFGLVLAYVILPIAVDASVSLARWRSRHGR